MGLRRNTGHFQTTDAACAARNGAATRVIEADPRRRHGAGPMGPDVHTPPTRRQDFGTVA